MPEIRCRTSGSGCTWSEVSTLDNSTLDKPRDVFDRDAEWADLTDFALSRLPGLRIAVVYGRRRQGKSYLLCRLTGPVGGLYHLATEQAEPVSPIQGHYRWPVEECHQQGKGQTGLDQHRVRTWRSFCRHTVLSMCAQALLAIAAACPAPSTVESPAPGGNWQPAAWRDTGMLPATAGDRPPGDDPGLVKVSVPEARRLLRLATTPMSQAARVT